MEFAEGNYGLLQGALEYSNDVTAPDVDDRVQRRRRRPATRSTTGSSGSTSRRSSTTRPTARRRRLDSPTYKNQGARRPGQVLTITALGVHDVKWIAVDIKGNVSAVKTPAAPDRGRRRERHGRRHGAGDARRSRSARRRRSGRSRRASRATTRASTTANVVSTAGDATLSASPTRVDDRHRPPGQRRVLLPQELQASATEPRRHRRGVRPPVGGSASPTTLLTYGAPASNDAVTVSFKQSIAANDALRTGAYGKTLTFTLSTTTP